MKKVTLVTLIYFLCFLSLAQARVPGNQASDSLQWKAGVAQAVITPREAIWMAGYASRNRPSEGKLHDLRAKALALEDSEGNRAVLITSDIIGFTKASSDRIRDHLLNKFGLARDRIILNSSHTHTGPEVDAMKYKWRVADMDPARLEDVNRYTNELENQVIQVVGRALQAMEPAQLYSASGVARFQVNRRNNSESNLDQQTDLRGPNDYAVPVIKIANTEGELLAIAFGYACHPTVLSGYKLSGDYAGFAQLELENRYPGVTALFFQGAAGDQNPLPRGTELLAEQYGRSLAAAVVRVLDEDMRPQPSHISTAYKEIDLPFAGMPSEEELLAFSKTSSGYQRNWALYMLDKLKRGETRMTSYPYPIQVWKLGDQPLISLAGEPVIDYAISLKRIFGPGTFVLGYSNDPNMAYIPTTRILREGGYEGASSQMAKGLPGTWSPVVETMILREVTELAVQAGIQPQAAALLGNELPRGRPQRFENDDRFSDEVECDYDRSSFIVNEGACIAMMRFRRSFTYSR